MTTNTQEALRKALEKFKEIYELPSYDDSFPSEARGTLGNVFEIANEAIYDIETALAATAEPEQPALYQFRGCFIIDGKEKNTDWEECTREQYEEIPSLQESSKYGKTSWFEVRAFYASPQVREQPTDERKTEGWLIEFTGPHGDRREYSSRKVVADDYRAIYEGVTVTELVRRDSPQVREQPAMPEGCVSAHWTNKTKMVKLTFRTSEQATAFYDRIYKAFKSAAPSPENKYE